MSSLEGKTSFLKALVLVGVLIVLLPFANVNAAWADTFTLTNTIDSGAGSLREAITKANMRAGADEIVFADGVSGTITLASTLLGSTDPEGLVIDGGGDVTVSGNDALLGDSSKDILLDVKGKGFLKGGEANDVLFTLDDAPLDTMDGQAGNDFCLGDKGDVRTNCERGGLLSLSEEERKRLDEAKSAAGRQRW